MCGIIGSVNNSDPLFFENSLKAIRHRGPDDCGYYHQDKLFLGQTRLSIIDLSKNGHQPMFSDDGRYCIVFNGEIYNHEELRKEYFPDKVFKSTSDTETLLNLLIEQGVSSLNMLNGIFAFAFFDKETAELLIVRDQFGVKPLYYYIFNDLLLFSSELKAINTNQFVDKSIDYKGLVNYIHFLYSPGERTPLEHVRKLLPGHYITVNINDLNSFKITQYYSIPFEGVYENFSEQSLIDKLDNLLEAAVKRQLLSDVPVGFFLSGGIDSSLIVAYARKLFPEKELECFTIDSGEASKKEGYDLDLIYAKKVARHLNVNLNVVQADVDIIRDFDKMIYHLDEPQADPAPLSVLNICKLAREKEYKVLLGGTAGDDVFSGYQRHKMLRFEKYIQQCPLAIRRLVVKLSKRLNNSNSFSRKFRKAVIDFPKTKRERMKGLFAWFPLEANKQLFKPNIRSAINEYDPSVVFDDLSKKIPNEKSNLNEMLFWELNTFLVDHNLNYTDKMGMAVGVEIRVPFLDKNLVEFSTLIPPHFKLKGVTTKYILKKVAERYLPNDIVYRKKGGFGGPVRTWVLNEMAPFIKERLSTEAIEKGNIFKAEEIHKLIEANKRGEIDAAYTIWSLMSINSFMLNINNVNINCGESK